MERGVPREVDGGLGEPVIRAEDPAAPVDERVDGERGPGVGRRHPEQHRGPTDREQLDRELDGPDPADRLEDDIGAAIGEVAERLDGRRAVIPGEDAVGRADRPCSVELRADPVDGDDAGGPGEHGTHHARQTHAAEADDGDGRTRLERGGLEHGPDPGRDAAADQRGDGRIDAVRERDRGGFGDDRRAGHRADRAIGEDRSTIPVREHGGPIRHPVPERRRIRAGPRTSCAARPADPTGHEPRERDRLADRQRVHIGPHRLDDACTLVPHHDRHRARPIAVAHVQVRVTDAGREHPDADLPGARLGDRQLLDRHGAPGRAQDRGPGRRHASPARRRSTGRAGS